MKFSLSIFISLVFSIPYFFMVGIYYTSIGSLTTVLVSGVGRTGNIVVTESMAYSNIFYITVVFCLFLVVINFVCEDGVLNRLFVRLVSK